MRRRRRSRRSRRRRRSSSNSSIGMATQRRLSAVVISKVIFATIISVPLRWIKIMVMHFIGQELQLPTIAMPWPSCAAA